jgi:hypothetical protein
MGKWVTPPTLPEDFYCRQIQIPNSPEWVGTVSGALLPLIYKNSWEQSEDGITPEEASTAAYAMLTTYWDSVCADEELPTPYWDGDTTADDEMPAETQEWYGMVTNPEAPADELTFVENAVIWIFQGFIALVLAPALPVGVAAAITFRTLATRFTLAFNRGDIIEQFRVIIDAQDYGTVDTSTVAAGEVVELEVNGIAEAAYHDIMIVRYTA